MSLNKAKLPSLLDKHEAQESELNELDVAVLDAKVVETPSDKPKRSKKKD